MPEELIRHDVCQLYGWTAEQYENAPALMIDWALEIESIRAQVAEERRDA